MPPISLGLDEPGAAGETGGEKTDNMDPAHGLAEIGRRGVEGHSGGDDRHEKCETRTFRRARHTDPWMPNVQVSGARGPRQSWRIAESWRPFVPLQTVLGAAPRTA